MVMHARKLQRLGDGYFERNQPHPYQNANSKYAKVDYGERYTEKMRDSPSNGTTTYRGESPDGTRPSPRDRSYHNKASYSQRIKERERERDSKRDKDSNKSPSVREKSKTTGNRDHYHVASHRSSAESGNASTEHRNNHDRIGNNEEYKEKEKEKRLQVGEWSEHISSSGKKYYYNCKTEVSQWEKPKEWMEWERQHGKLFNDAAANKLNKDGNHDKSSTSDKHSNERNFRAIGHPHHSMPRPHDDRYHASRSLSASTSSTAASSSSAAASAATATTSSTSSSSASSSCIRGHAVDHAHRNSQQQQSSSSSSSTTAAAAAAFKEERLSRHLERNSDHRHQFVDPAARRDGERRTQARKSSDDSQLQDMDISSDSTPPLSQTDKETPASSSSQFSGLVNQQQQQQPQQTPPLSSSSSSSGCGGGGGSSLANLPKLISQLTANKANSHMEKPELSAHEALQTLQTALYLTRQVTLSHPNIPSQSSHSSLCSQPERSPVALSSQTQLSASSVSTGGEQKSRNDDERDRAARSSPGSEYSHRSSRRDSPTSSICSLQGITSASGTTSLASASLRPSAPTISPSLANYFRDDLIGHIMGWQADHAERQANKYSEDAHHIGSLTCTKVSADLKMARSLVRVGEIQATVQEQRILFLRQQIKELEEWKSQNSFMSNS